MVHLSGLRKKASYDELINYINTDKTKIIYPNRRATFLANSPQISSLLELDVMDQQDQEIKKAKVAMSLGVKMEEPNTRTNVNNAGIPSTTNVSNNYYTSYNTGIPPSYNTGIPSTVPTGAKHTGHIPNSLPSGVGQGTQFFDIADVADIAVPPDLDMNDNMDEAAQVITQHEEDMRSKSAENRSKIRKIVENHLGEQPVDIPYLAPKYERSRSPKLKNEKIASESMKVEVKNEPPKLEPMGAKTEPMDTMGAVKREAKSEPRSDIKRQNTEETKVKTEPNGNQRADIRYTNSYLSAIQGTIDMTPNGNFPAGSPPPRPRSNRGRTSGVNQNLSAIQGTIDMTDNGNFPAGSPPPRPGTSRGRTTQPRPTQRSRTKSKDDDVQISGININRSQDFEFWKNQSANELRAQLILRGNAVGQRKDYAFLPKQQLLSYVKKLIQDKKW